MQGLQHHIESSHDLFDFGYPKTQSGGAPTVAVRCPKELFDAQGRLPTLESDELGTEAGKVDLPKSSSVSV